MTLERGWHPDPTGRFELRLWNGREWTSQVNANGVTTVDSFDPDAAWPGVASPGAETSLLGLASVSWSTSGDTVELYGPDGALAGKATEVSGGLAAAVEWLTKWDVAEDLWEVREADGTLLLVLRKPPAGAPLLVARADGEAIGSVRSNLFGPPFTLHDASEQAVASLAWDGGDHAMLLDAAGERVGVYGDGTLTFERDLDPTLRTLAIATIVALYRYERTL